MIRCAVRRRRESLSHKKKSASARQDFSGQAAKKVSLREKWSKGDGAAADNTKGHLHRRPDAHKDVIA